MRRERRPADLHRDINAAEESARDRAGTLPIVGDAISARRCPS
jgi:hypothetical protein